MYMYIYFLTIWIILDILYRFYRFIVLTVPNAHDCDAVHLPSRDSKNLVTLVFMTSLCVDSYEKKKRVEFCCFKRCTRCISIKAFITLKQFLCSWGVFNKMRLYIENVTSIFFVLVSDTKFCRFFFLTNHFYIKLLDN